MRHAVKGRKLGRTSSHREALFRNQLQSLVVSEKIITTLPKAKELRPIAERVITRGKQDSVHARRWVLRWVLRRDLVKKVFDEIAPRFATRPGGYLRIVKLGPRLGDGAEMALLELVDREESAGAKEGAKGAKPGARKGLAGRAGRAGGARSGKGRTAKEAARGKAEGAEGEADEGQAGAKAAQPRQPSQRKPRRGGDKSREGREGKGGEHVKSSTRGSGKKPPTPRKAV